MRSIRRGEVRRPWIWRWEGLGRWIRQGEEGCGGGWLDLDAVLASGAGVGRSGGKSGETGGGRRERGRYRREGAATDDKGRTDAVGKAPLRKVAAQGPEMGRSGGETGGAGELVRRSNDRGRGVKEIFSPL